MSAIKVNFEIGHEASLRSKKTPEGYTHDWEVFVRGQEGADISHFVDKVVFHLHKTFEKPIRVVKEPPYIIKESGYGEFTFPIEIYVKNKDEPKKVKFTYNLTLQQSGFLKDRYIFEKPNEEFRKKLLKGGGIPYNSNAFYANPEQESKSRDSFIEEKLSKSKQSDGVKKHKSKENKDEVPHKTSNFEHLFGPPIQKPPKVSPDPKKVDKNVALKIEKSEKKEKERSNSDKKSKHEHKESKPEKVKIKEEKDKNKSEKIKNHIKEQEKSKEKASKRASERPPSPELAKKRCVSPLKRPASSPQRSSSASSIKEEYKQLKSNLDNIDQKKPKLEDKLSEPKIEKDIKEKKKKEKKSHDKDKERKEKKEQKKEHKSKDSPKEQPKEVPPKVQELPKPREIPKEKELIKDTPIIKEKPSKPEKVLNKFSLENLRKTPTPEIEERPDSRKSKQKGDSERKHKHKKKDKKRDESKEKHKESSKEKKHKHDRSRESISEKPDIVERREPSLPKERVIPEPASPISIDTASQCSSKSGIAKSSHIEPEDCNSSHSDSESSIIEDDEDRAKVEPSPEPMKQEPSPEPEPEEPDPEPEIELEPEVEPDPEPHLVVEPPPHKEKSKKHKSKNKEEKRRKRKAAEGQQVENRKVPKTEPGALSKDEDHGESSGSTSMETKVQDNGVSSSLGEDAEPGDLSPDYMVQLRGLQQRIMMIKNNEDLERVVNLIAETGRYEVTTQTFDFDLCLLDRSTVQQLIQLVGC